MILAPAQLSLPQKFLHITLKLMIIFHRRVHDLFFLQHLVILRLDMAVEEAWAQGQISRYPGWYTGAGQWSKAIIHSGNGVNEHNRFGASVKLQCLIGLEI